jgi:hypothetical protein
VANQNEDTQTIHVVNLPYTAVDTLDGFFDMPFPTGGQLLSISFEGDQMLAYVIGRCNAELTSKRMRVMCNDVPFSVCENERFLCTVHLRDADEIHALHFFTIETDRLH